MGMDPSLRSDIGRTESKSLQSRERSTPLFYNEEKLAFVPMRQQGLLLLRTVGIHLGIKRSTTIPDEPSSSSTERGRLLMFRTLLITSSLAIPEA